MLTEGKRIIVSWDCGGDQATISTMIDGVEIDHTESFAEELEIYLINFLTLPDVGEFYMKGSGDIKFSNNQIVIEYSSQVLELEIGEEELKFMEEELGIKTTEKEEKNSMSAEYTGSKTLFQDK